MEHQMAELTRVILAQSESIKSLEAKSDAIQAKSDAIQAAVEEIKPVVIDLQSWKPEMETSMEGLRLEVGDLRMQITQIARNPVLTVRPVDLPPILPLPETKPEPWTEKDRLPPSKENAWRAREERVVGP